MRSSTIRRCFSMVTLNFNDLKAGKNLTEQIFKAFGPQGHGLLLVSNIPEYKEQRQATLPLFRQLGQLSPAVLSQYERKEIFHAQGWSRGVEKFAGKTDYAKGSYYYNAVDDKAYRIHDDKRHLFTKEELIIAEADNVWVQELPALKKNVKSLSQLMIGVAKLLARAIDVHLMQQIKNYRPNNLEKTIVEGRGHIGRILHYFPFENSSDINDDWCGWHNDHGSLTALTSAMYFDKEGKEVIPVAQDGGLYAKNRLAEEVRISIPSDMLAFQIGECMQIQSDGVLEATPHCVVRPKQFVGKGVSRETLALFMEPNHLDVLSSPSGGLSSSISTKKAYKVPQMTKRWTNNCLFKDFHSKTLKEYA